NGVGGVARFFNPHGITYDGVGNLYVADYNNNEIRKIIVATAAVSTLAGSVATGGTNTDAVGALAGFNNPYGLAYDWNGNLFVADNNNNNIRKVVIATATVSTFAGSLFMNPGHTNAVGTAALFNSPTQVAINGNGNIYVADQANDVIRQIVIATASVSDLAGTAGTTGTTNGPVAIALFNFPGGICLDYLGNIFIGDCNNNEIREITSVPLPIKLEYFNAENNGKQNILNWVTATETNNNYFTIERCDDGIAFEPILTVKGAGNSTTPLSYKAYDESPNTGINYYRLKQTDFDGHYSYSDIVPVFLSTENDIVIFPNPVTTDINLAYNSTKANAMMLRVVDITGKVMRSFTFNLSPGNNNLQINTNDLAPGLYILQADFASGNTFYKKFIKE
ncbi:MAG TPA: T9SS type A sorting domain-containing protein, partial [Bacteroidia bacterium]|nr:T9SS type A sorting domain-containing protein [Bacteroidia bacterium]